MIYKKQHIQKLVYLILVIFSLPVLLYSQNIKFKRLSIDEGLSTVSVNTIFQDSQEFYLDRNPGRLKSLLMGIISKPIKQTNIQNPQSLPII